MLVCAWQAKAGSAKKGKGKKAAKAKDGSSYEAMVPCYELLACEYHTAMVSGLTLIGADSPSQITPKLLECNPGGRRMPFVKLAIRST